MFSPLSLAGIWTPGFGEMVIIFLVVLVIFGPKNIPALARSLGQGLKEFKNASSKFTDAIDEAAREEERKSPATPAPARQIPPASPPEAVSTSPQAAPLKEGH